MSKKRKRRFAESPAWAIAGIAGAVVWGVVTVLTMVFFEAALMPALAIGAACCTLIAAPALLSEAAAGVLATVLEMAAGIVGAVIALPLILLSSCG